MGVGGVIRQIIAENPLLAHAWKQIKEDDVLMAQLESSFLDAHQGDGSVVARMNRAAKTHGSVGRAIIDVIEGKNRSV